MPRKDVAKRAEYCREYREKHRERRNELERARRKINPLGSFKSLEAKNAYYRARYSANKEKYRSEARAQYRKNPAAAIAATKKWKQKHPEKARLVYRNISLKKAYGITLAQFEEMLAAQDGRCAICDESPMVGVVLCVDHNHNTGAIRGLLCGKCNSILGYAKESETILTRAIHYLHKFR